MLKHTLYIGLNDKNSKIQVINTLDAYKILMNLVKAAGYEGATISEATGFYTHESGEITIEKTLRVEILFADENKTRAFAEAAKRALNQESIAIQRESIVSDLI